MPRTWQCAMRQVNTPLPSCGPSGLDELGRDRARHPCKLPRDGVHPYILSLKEHGTCGPLADSDPSVGGHDTSVCFYLVQCTSPGTAHSTLTTPCVATPLPPLYRQGNASVARLCEFCRWNSWGALGRTESRDSVSTP